MRKFFLLFLMCVVSMAIYAQEPDYYIQGDVTISAVPNPKTGKKEAQFILNNAFAKGIEADNLPSEQIIGKPDTLATGIATGTQIFTFRNAQTDCPDGFKQKLHFERYIKETGEWQRDTEVDQVDAKGSLTSWTTIILVLDHTSSLDDKGLKDVKHAACKFIDDIVNNEEYIDGSVHLGIVAFAASASISSIKPLSRLSANKIKDFINDLEMENNTYLYHAIDEAFSMFERYRPSDKQLEDYQGASLITFTDGFDNGSINIEKEIMNNEAYYNYLKDERLPLVIHNKPINSYMISITGKDVKEESLYVEKLKNLATIPSQFFKVENTSRLEEQFAKILSQLTTSWVDLNCYIPQHQGRVRWVLDCGEPKKEPKQPSKYMSQLGFILGANNGITGKGYATDKHFAYEFDASYNLYIYSLDFLSNYMYQNVAHQGKKSDMHWYVGAGASFGYSLGYMHEMYDGTHWANWRIGANAIVGLEWIFRNSPFVLSLDYRPGIHYFIGWNCDALYFDYLNINLGLRWYF